MGYRTDQFYNLGWGEQNYGNTANRQSNPGSTYSSGGDNGTFMYPERVVRTADHDGYKTTGLKRGYIRSLRTQLDGIEVEVKKCQFQFNPALLQQSVVQQEGLLNVFQSDPAQYAQPIPGNVSFSFDLLFDRTMEVNNAGVARGTNNSVADRAANNILDPNNPWELSDPSQVGVLRDIASLFAVIGQGVSQSQSDYLQNVLQQQFEREKAAAQKWDADFDETEYNAQKETIPDFLASNVGNTAFLLPVPVRAVFSSLYIVEGFVTQTSVAFQKFNTSMVPIQASVTLDMDAKYIGFAQPKTFLTYALDQEIKAYEEQQRQTEETLSDISDAAVKALPSVELAVRVGSGTTNYSLYDFIWDNPSGQYGQTRFHWRFTKRFNQQPIIDLFEDATLTGAAVTGGIEVYGPYNYNHIRKLAPNQSGWKAGIKPSDLIGSVGLINPSQQFPGGSKAVHPVANSAAEWLRTANECRGPSNLATLWPNDPSDDYYIVKYHVQVQFSGTQNVRGQGESYQLVNPGMDWYKLKAVVPISWPTYSGAEVGTVVDTPGPNRTTPGYTSDVGKTILPSRAGTIY